MFGCCFDELKRWKFSVVAGRHEMRRGRRIKWLHCDIVLAAASHSSVGCVVRQGVERLYLIAAVSHSKMQNAVHDGNSCKAILSVWCRINPIVSVRGASLQDNGQIHSRDNMNSSNYFIASDNERKQLIMICWGSPSSSPRNGVGRG